jgi:hypothetical protein
MKEMEIVNMTPGSAENLSMDKHSSLLGRIVSGKENVLKHWYQVSSCVQVECPEELLSIALTLYLPSSHLHLNNPAHFRPLGSMPTAANQSVTTVATAKAFKPTYVKATEATIDIESLQNRLL